MTGLPNLSRGTLALMVNAVLGLLALGLVFAPAGEGAPRIALSDATGYLALSNSREGAAIFVATGMRPDEQAGGTVRIANTGTVAGALQLTRSPEGELAGVGGGRLSDRLRLLVLDVTSPQAPIAVYDGSLGAMPLLDLGRLEPGEGRQFQFSVSLPGAAAGNEYQGAQLAAGFTWTAVAAVAPEPTATPTPAPITDPAPPPSDGSTPPPPPGSGVLGATLTGASVFKLPSAKRCVSRRKFAIHIRRPKGVRFAAIRITVNGKSKLRLKGTKARRVKPHVNLRGLPAGRVRVKITATTTRGRKLVSKRTYRTCAGKTVKKKHKRARHKSARLKR